MRSILQARASNWALLIATPLDPRTGIGDMGLSLLRVCLIYACSWKSCAITTTDVINSNNLFPVTERLSKCHPTHGTMGVLFTSVEMLKIPHKPIQTQTN